VRSEVKMTRTCVSSATTATNGTEQTLLDDTSNRGSILDAFIDLSAMTATETFEIRVYVKVLTGGTLHEIYYAKYIGAQLDETTFRTPVVYVPAITEPYEWKLTLKRVAGTDRAVDWAVYRD